MNRPQTFNQGYAGIISLLIVVLIISVILIRPDILTGKKETKGTLETGMDAVNQAKEVKLQVEQKSNVPDELLEQ